MCRSKTTSVVCNKLLALTYVYSINPRELEIKDTTESFISAICMNTAFNKDSKGKLTTRLDVKLVD